VAGSREVPSSRVRGVYRQRFLIERVVLEEEGCDDQLSAGGQMGRGRVRCTSKSVRGRLNKADIGGETEV